MNPLSLRARIGLAAVVTAVLAGTAVGYASFAAGRADRDAPAETVAEGVRLGLDPGPVLLVATDRHLALVSRDAPAGPRTVSAWECVRVYAAGGTGVCLHPQNPWSYEAVVLDRDLRQVRAVAVPGLPNRARVSPSGRMVAWTTFVAGHTYNGGSFSTSTGILDVRTGALVRSLEEFAITRDGRAYRAADVNFWGVTFAADDNRFYATMATGGRRYLVEGDFAARTVRTVVDNVECPSLSPAGTRVAFKRAVDGDPDRGWRLSVLDLRTMLVTPLAEPASVDDQPAWLDGATIGYTKRGGDGDPDVWAVPADGSGEPRLLIPGAESPASLSVPGI